jgi:SAM-dependent methyltransferase
VPDPRFGAGAPWAYELACSFRDVSAEVESLLRWYSRHADEKSPRSVLELAAGPAEHARELARRGHVVTALDLNPAMCAYAKEHCPALDVVEADMRTFALGRTYDLVVTMLDSTAHLHTLDDMVAYLDRTADHLAAGGVAVVEMGHPADRLTSAPRASGAWDVERDGRTGVVRWGEPTDHLDPITQIVDEHVTIVVDGGEVLVDVVPYRFWTATELTAAVRLSGRLGIVAQYGDFADVDLHDAEAWRMITVLA